MLSLSSWSIKLLRFENWNFSRVKKIARCEHHLSHVSFFLILTRALEHIVCLGESHLSQVNNSRRADVFPAGVANFGKAMYRSLERSTQDTQDWFFGRVPRPHFFGRSLIWPGYFREHILGLFGLHPSSLSKSAGFVFLSGKASLVSISAAILLLRSWHVYFPLEFEFRGKSCVEWEHVGENGISCFLPCILLLYIEWIWTNYCKLSRNFVAAIRTTTTNCRVSFIDLYLVFPINFRMVFLPHTNTKILLEPYCGTITEHGDLCENYGDVIVTWYLFRSPTK